MSGEIFFNMTEEDHPISGSSSKFLFKRWKRYNIYSKSGEYSHTNNPSENLYSSCSIYLYDYIVVNKEYYESLVHTETENTLVPGIYSNSQRPIGYMWEHSKNTFKLTPNLTTNNYQLTNSISSNIIDSGGNIISTAYNVYVKVDDGEYLEIVSGYPESHFTHKRDLFSLYNMSEYEFELSGSYIRNCQTISTTVGSDGLEDGSSPIETISVGNLNLLKSDNVINSP